MKKIITSHDFPPIPYRGMDWCAYFEGEEEEGHRGYGPTEAAAIADLKSTVDDEDLILRQRIACPACGGEGGHEVFTGYDPRDGQPTGYRQPCTHCNATGTVEEDIPPLEMDERDEEQPLRPGPMRRKEDPDADLDPSHPFHQPE